MVWARRVTATSTETGAVPSRGCWGALSAFRAGRLVEAFAWGMSLAELARRFRVSRARVEAAIRRAARRGKTAPRGNR